MDLAPSHDLRAPASLRERIRARLGAGRRPAPWLVALAAVGAALLLVVAASRWGTTSDEGAYWRAAERLIAGQPVYDAAAPPGTPYAYLYPPPLAQVLAPLTRVIGEPAFSAGWTVLLLGCLLFLARWRPLVALALVAFVPVAVELWFRNVHLLLAALVVLGLRGAPWALGVAAAVKVSPGLGIVYLAARGRWREAAIGAAAGLAILGVSVALDPRLWQSFVEVIVSGAPTVANSLLPVPYPVRALAAFALAIVAGRLPEQPGDALLVMAIVLGSPSLYVTSLSLLVAIVPLVWSHRGTAVPARPALGAPA